MTLDAGSNLGSYRIESLIGRGGMGAVYLATDARLDRRVALKVLSPELTEDQTFRQRFIAESKTAASLDHPNIVPVYEAGEVDGRLFIAMRYVEGRDLSHFLAERGILPVPLVIRILAAAGAALDAAHAKGLVHRDVKPGNVLLTGPDDAPLVYLTDFGLSKRFGDQSLTRAGQIVGSIHYVAPEQVEGRPVDARTDVYSLGCLAFELLSGTAPFQRESEMATLMAHVQDPPPSLLAVRPELPEALDAAVAQAMAKDPAARYATAGQCVAAVTDAARPDSGAITRGFMFADLRGYTAYVEAYGDAAGSALLEVYRRLMRDTIARHGGAEIKTEGDSFYVVFPSASSAVAGGLGVVAAAAAQAASDPDHPIRVGVGIHAGESVAAAEGYVGSAVNIAARVCALAMPGEVLVTDTVRSLTRTSGRVTFTTVGRKALKGIAEPMTLVRAEPARSGVKTVPAARRPIWRRPLVLAGATGALLVGVLAVVASTGGLTAGRPAASASPSASAAQSIAPGPVPYGLGVLDPGTYVTDTFNIRMQFAVGPGWSGLRNRPDNIAIGHEHVPGSEFQVYDVQVVFDGPCEDSPTRVLGSEPRDLVTYFQGHPYLTASPALPYSVAGYTGLAMQISLASHPTEADCPGGGTALAGAGEQFLVHLIRTIGDGGFRVGDGNQVWVVAVQVDERLVGFFIEAPRGTKFLEFQDRALDVFRTLTFL